MNQHIADLHARWNQTQRDGMAVIEYLTSEPDHEATTVMVAGGYWGDEPGTVVPGTVGVEHGYPRAEVIFPDGSTFAFHTARLAPYTPIRLTDDAVLCAVCHA